MFKVLCIDGLVDGITENKKYTVIEVFDRPDGMLYGVEKDDYGIYNEFKAKRFIKCK